MEQKTQKVHPARSNTDTLTRISVHSDNYYDTSVFRFEPSFKDPFKPKTSPTKSKKFKIIVIIVCTVTAAIIIAIVLGLIPVYLQSNKSATLTSQTSTTRTTKSTSQTTVSNCIPLNFVTSDSSQNSLYKLSFKCSSTPIYAYKPSFLSIQNSVLYGHPIKQEIACNNANIELKCPSNQIIHILSAYYGIQSSTTTDCISYSSDMPSVCYNKDSFDKVQTQCENKQSCSISATTGFFGEPCPGASKQLFLQYQCIDSNALIEINKCSVDKTISSICPAPSSNTVHEQKWCEPTVLGLTCSIGQLIRIICGFYGIDPTQECSGTFKSGNEPTYCYSQSSTEKLISLCHGKRTCTISGDPNFVIGSGFTNVCTGYAKVLYVQWECYEENVATTTTTTVSSSLSSSEQLCSLSNSKLKNCQTNSPFEPSFLTNSTNNYFDYQIFQQIICNNAKVVLKCPSNQVLFIYSAYYGIQTDTNSNTCILARVGSAEDIPTKCYFPNSLSLVKTTCENKSECSLTASTSVFQDPCSTYPKQLFVQYQCMHTDEVGFLSANCPQTSNKIAFVCTNVTDFVTIKEQIWCDGSTMSISCTGSLKLEIVCAFYGIHLALSACNIPSLSNPPVCYYGNTVDYLKSICDGQSSCSLENFADTFTDPCVGFDKALYVQWRCS